MVYILAFIKTLSVRQIQMQRQHEEQISAPQLFQETCKLGVRTSASEDTRKAKLYRLQPHDLFFDLSCLWQSSKLLCLSRQLGHLCCSEVDRNMACGNTLPIIRNHGKSDSCIKCHPLLWYFKMSSTITDCQRGKNNVKIQGTTTSLFTLIKLLLKMALIAGV